ncbi:MAG: hypothetical protein CHACPFDD_04042 [Phycisphaerae bacterium]|nr:hypothetical protein [Phycisphaerae bacterium]
MNPIQPDAPFEAEPVLPAITDEIFCPACGYNLLGLMSPRCPECGRPVDALRDAEPRLPWARDDGSRFVAFWKTVLFVTFRSEDFSVEICRPVDERRAHAFRRRIVWCIWITMLTPVGFIAWFSPGELAAGMERLGLPVAVASAMAWLAGAYLLAAVPEYIVAHRDAPLVRRHRAALLTSYATAPLVWLLPCPLFGFAAAMLWNRRGVPWDILLWLLAAFVPLAVGAITLIDVVRLVRRMFREVGPVTWITCKVIATWVLVAVLMFVLLPASFLLIAVVVWSVR